MIIWAAVVGVSLVNCLMAGASMEWPSHLVGTGLNILALFFIALRSPRRSPRGRATSSMAAGICVLSS